MMSPPIGRVEHPRRDAVHVLLRDPLRDAPEGVRAAPGRRRSWRFHLLRAYPQQSCRATFRANLPDLALQLPHARLAGVLLHDGQDRRRPSFAAPRPSGCSPCADAASRYRFTISSFSASVYPAKSTRSMRSSSGPGNAVEVVRRRDEEHLGEVERHAEVVVDEGRVLRRVEHLEERGAGVSLERDAQLVDLVEQEDRDSSSSPAACPG